MLSKSKLIKTFGPLGGYAAIRWWMRREPRILMFHRFSSTPQKGCISAEVFEAQLLYIKRHFNVLPLSLLRRAHEECNPLPNNSLVLTVDDGYRDFYEVAYPILTKHGLPATLFVTTGFVNKELWLWPDKITWLLKHAESMRGSIDLGDRCLESQTIDSESRGRIWGEIIPYLLSVNDELKHVWIEQFAKVLGQVLPSEAPPGFEACSWNELREMQDNGIELGGHTHTHPSLGQVDDTQLFHELDMCRQLLVENLGETERDFCFPNGQPNDYSSGVIQAVQVAGFRSSVTAFYDAKGISQLFEMRRHVGSESWFQFYKSVNGAEACMAKYANANNRMGGDIC